MSRAATKDDAEALAAKLGEIVRALPEGLILVNFMIADLGSHYETVVVANGSAEDFAPVIRRWLERYDAGEAVGHDLGFDA